MIWNLRTSQVDDACVVRTKDLTEDVYNGFNTCYIAIDIGHTLSQEKQEFGEEAGHLFWLQKPKSIYCQIHHFCQVSAGYDAPVPWNWTSRKRFSSSLHFECNDLFLTQHLSSTPQSVSWGTSRSFSQYKILQYLRLLLLLWILYCCFSLEGSQAEGGEPEVLFAGLQIRLLKKKSRGKQRDGNWPYLPSVTKMPCSSAAFLAWQDQTSPPTKLQSVKENVYGRHLLCLEFSLSLLHMLLSRPGLGYLLPGNNKTLLFPSDSIEELIII